MFSTDLILGGSPVLNSLVYFLTHTPRVFFYWVPIETSKVGSLILLRQHRSILRPLTYQIIMWMGNVLSFICSWSLFFNKQNSLSVNNRFLFSLNPFDLNRSPTTIFRPGTQRPIRGSRGFVTFSYDELPLLIFTFHFPWVQSFLLSIILIRDLSFSTSSSTNPDLNQCQPVHIWFSFLFNRPLVLVKFLLQTVSCHHPTVFTLNTAQFSL